MKTTTNNINFPGTAKFFAFVILISGLAFLSCMVASAQVSKHVAPITFINEMDDSYADVLKSSANFTGINMDQVWAARLERALVTETEPRIEVESWMINTESTTESNPELEAWMLDTEFTAEATEESLELEDWMLNVDYFYNAETCEETIELEDWMLDADYFTVAHSDEEPLELEDWMIE